VRGYLLDTNVVSETRKGRRTNANVLAWFESVDDDALFLSVLVIGEIRKGIEQARPKDPVKTRALEEWLNGLEQGYGDQILPITPMVADKWGRLSAIRPLSTVDGLLAATAMVHDLTLTTRNSTDVARTGVVLLNPFTSS
jgi:predicted nucleic acid-binding protein